MGTMDARFAAMAANLRVDSLTGEVVETLRDAGVRAIVLKGPAVARWLYDTPGERSYGDSDLLIAPRDRRRAERVLRRMGMSPGGFSWLQQARAWRREGRVVDLHISLFGVGVRPDQAWAVLSRETEWMRVGGVDIEILTPTARALHLATHATQHPGVGLHPAQDLERGLSRLSPSTWEAAAGLARELQAEPTFAAGLCRVAGGAALADRLGVQGPARPELILLASGAPSTAVSFAQLAAAGSVRLRVVLLVRAVLPPPSVIRASSSAASGAPGLALAYVERLMRLRHSPAGFRAWRRALRASRGECGP